MKSDKSLCVDVVQVGAREHYAVPTMLHECGLLRQFHTDVYTGPGSWLGPICQLPVLARASTALKRLSQRRSDLPASKVFPHNLIGLRGTYRLRRAKTAAAQAHAHHWMTHAISRAYLRNLRTPADATIGFRGSDVLFEGLRGKSLCILDQIDGGIHEAITVRAEVERHLELHPELRGFRSERAANEPHWLEDIEAPRLRREWELADRIVCNSKWTVSCLAAQGVPTDKCTIIPLAYEPHAPCVRGPKPPSAPGQLRVGFLGTLTIRKGIHLLCEAVVRAAQEADVTLHCAGPVHPLFGREQIAKFAPVVHYVGAIPRADVPGFLQTIDVLALPSISEGFGIVQLEAMARGVPVIASERTGEVVMHERNGLLVRAGDVQEIVNAILRLAKDHELLAELGRNALTTLGRFSRSTIAGQWAAAVAAP